VFPFLDGIQCLTILKENDAASEQACETCGTRWHTAGREVLIDTPMVGSDLNDALRRNGVK
jgi:putative DNA primase/helicase